MRLFRQTFDFVFSIGEDCACASYLNWHRLRVESSPFDWLTRASFATRTGLLENGFAEFLQCENMRQIPKPTEGYRDEKCDYYADDATDFYFYHDFPAGIALNASFPAVKEKYQRRISRLLGRLASSREVLMVWWSRDKRLSDSELLDALDRLQWRYPNVRLSLLAFEQSDNVRRVDHVASNVIRVIDRICPDVNVTWGDRRVCDRYFRSIRTTYTSWWKETRKPLLYALAWTLAKFHFTQAGRRNACERWVARFGIGKKAHVE